MNSFLTAVLRQLSWVLGFIDHGFLLLKALGPAQPKFFRTGYGNVNTYRTRLRVTLSELDNRPAHSRLSDNSIDWGKLSRESHITIQEARFLSPISQQLPTESTHCKFHLVRPVGFDETKEDESTYILMLPATGEIDIFTRLHMARQLAKEYGWCSVIPTAPFYGDRRPQAQTLFFLNSVADMFLQSEGIIEEAAALSMYLISKSTKTKVCFTGFSFGAAMAACASSFALKTGVDGSRMGCAAYVGSASPCILADGILESAVNWEALSRRKTDDREKTRQELFAELCKVQLDVFVPPEENRMAVVKGYAMAHDGFIKPKYSREFESQIRRCLNVAFQMEWRPGGHAFAAAARAWLQKKLLVSTIQELEQGQT